MASNSMRSISSAIGPYEYKEESTVAALIVQEYIRNLPQAITRVQLATEKEYNSYSCNCTLAYESKVLIMTVVMHYTITTIINMPRPHSALTDYYVVYKLYVPSVPSLFIQSPTR